MRSEGIYLRRKEGTLKDCGEVLDINHLDGLEAYYHKEFLLNEKKTQHRIYEDEIQMAVSGNVDYDPWLTSPFDSDDVSTTLTTLVELPVVSISVSPSELDYGTLIRGETSDTVYFEIDNAEVRRMFSGQRAAERELRRRK